MRRSVLAGLALLALTTGARPQGREVWPNTVPALSNTATAVLAQAGTLLAYSCYNPNAASGWVQVFDTVGSVTVGTTVPRVSLPLPPASGSGVTASGGLPLSLVAGLKVAATTTQQGSTALSSAVSCDFFSR